jgi:hypothetical protein
MAAARLSSCALWGSFAAVVERVMNRKEDLISKIDCMTSSVGGSQLRWILFQWGHPEEHMYAVSLGISEIS